MGLSECIIDAEVSDYRKHMFIVGARDVCGLAGATSRSWWHRG
jgi:hypothetical protein